LRRAHIVPRLAARHRGARFAARGAGGVEVDWIFADGAVLRLRANFSDAPEPSLRRAPGALLHAQGECAVGEVLPAWGGTWTLEA
jgi:hypothetical protein